MSRVMTVQDAYGADKQEIHYIDCLKDACAWYGTHNTMCYNDKQHTQVQS
jgi:hypothetical protein